MPRHSENEQRDQKMMEMREDGYTLQQIADVFNISRQRVHHIVGNRDKGFAYFKENITYSVYPAIDQWFHDNRVTYAKFVEMCGWRYNPSMQKRIKMILHGSEVKKTHIDRILRATGLSYEDAFGGNGGGAGAKRNRDIQKNIGKRQA